jgi:putative transposase
MERHRLTDEQWERIAPLVAGKEGDPGRSGADNRRFVEAVLWLSRTGAPWRDLPAEFGPWNSVFRRFSRWAKRGVWARMLQALAEDPDFEAVLIDATVIRAHQHAAGQKGGFKTRRSAAPAAASARKSMSPWTPSATRSGRCSPPVKFTKSLKPKR